MLAAGRAALHARGRLGPRVQGAGRPRATSPRSGSGRRSSSRSTRSPGARVSRRASRGSSRSSTSARARSRSWSRCPGRADLVGGLFARASVRVGQVDGALVVPPAALVRDGSDPTRPRSSWCAAARPRRSRSTLGVEAPDGVQVTSGLAAGDMVVLDPPTALASGAPVEVQNERGAAGAGRSRAGGEVGAGHVPEQPLDQAPGLRDHDDGRARRPRDRLLLASSRSTSSRRSRSRSSP